MSRMLVFDSREWRKAGGDQPDGNARFWHEAEILKRYPHREGLGDLAVVRFLHDGRVSRGHYVDCMRPVAERALGTTRTTGDEH